MEVYDEPYHCSPASAPDDILWEGSDAEESPEETQAKRARYEEQAERCNNGFLPTLLSAGLNGPFNQESGWVNPWRYKPQPPPKSIQEDGWWKPGSEDMTFTRKNVLKRAVDHGLGWMTPGAALRWCKAAATTEARAINRDQTDFGGEVMEFGQQFHPRKIYANEQLLDSNNDHVRKTHRNPRTTAGRNLESFAKGRNLLRDLQRAKKLDVPRRAWWDGDTIPSPTPLPSRPQKKNSALMRLEFASAQSLSSQRASSFTRPSSHSQASQKRKRSLTSRPNGPTKRIRDAAMSGSQLENTNREPISTSRSGNSFQDVNHAREKIQVPDDTISALSFSYGSTVKSVSRGMVANDTGHPLPYAESDSESDRSIYGFPKEHNSGKPSIPTNSESSLRPDIRIASNDDVAAIARADSPNEASFVTEVASSCGDLEKFQFRRKRKVYHQPSRLGPDYSLTTNKIESPLKEPNFSRSTVHINKVSVATESSDIENEWETTIAENDRFDGDEGFSVQRSGSNKRNNQRGAHRASPDYTDDCDDAWETTLGDDSNFSPPEAISGSGQNRSLHKSKSSARSVGEFKRSSTPPRSQHSGSAQGLTEEVINCTYSPKTATASIRTRSRRSKPQQNSSNPASKATSSVEIKAGPRSSILPLEQSSNFPASAEDCAPSLAKWGLQAQIETNKSSHKSARIRADRADEIIDQNELSTQSANTTPTRSRPVIRAANSPPEATLEIEYLRKGEAIEIKASSGAGAQQTRPTSPGQILDEDEDLMARIQKTLSQNCVSSQESKSSRGCARTHETSQERKLNISTRLQGSGQRRHSRAWNDSASIGSANPREGNLGSTLSSENDALSQSAINSTSRDVDPPQSPLPGAALEMEMQGIVTPNIKPDSCLLSSKLQTPWVSDNGLSLSTVPKITAGLVVGTGTILERHEDINHSDWPQFESTLLATNKMIDPRRTFETPKRSSKIGLHDVNKTVSQQEDSMIHNPWTSSLKRTRSSTKKGVSFGILQSEEDLSSEIQDSILKLPSQRSSPSQSYLLDDGNPPPRPILVAKSRSASQKIFKRILPDVSASQLNSSPAPVEAMAEAFITADQEAPRKSGQPYPEKMGSQSLRVNRASSFGENATEDPIFTGTTRDSQGPGRIGDLEPEFDLEEALGDANAFLEDWSVEAELDKARSLDSKAYESNGMKRRKMFGII